MPTPPTPAQYAAFDAAMRTGTLAQAQAALAALFTSAGDQAGATWATAPCPAPAKKR